MRYATKPIRTYNLLNQMKIIIMSDSYDAIRAFLLNGVNKHEENQNQTNLRNVVQDSNEWVAVLEARCHAVFQSPGKATHTRDIWDSRHLHLAVPSPVGIIGKRFSRSPKASVKSQEDTFRSETPDEYALGLRWVGL